MVFKQEINIGLALTIGFISGLLLLVMTFGMQAWFESAETSMVAEKLEGAAPSDFVQLKQEQAKSIEKLDWANKERTAVKIPISRAMALMVETNGKLPSTQPTSQPTTRPSGSASGEARPSGSGTLAAR